MIQKNKHALIVWLLVSLFSLFQFFLQVATSLMTAPLMLSFHLDNAGIGFLSSAFFYTYMLTQIPAGLLLDRFGIRKVLLCAVATCGIGCALFALSHHFVFAFLSRLVMGMGAGFAFVGMLFSSSSNFNPSRIALMIGLAEFLGMFGSGLAQHLVPYAVLSFGWRAVLLTCAFIAFLLWLSMKRWLIDQPRHTHSEHLGQQIMSNLKQVIKLPIVWLCGVFCFGMFSIISTFVSLWGVPYLENVQHLSYLEATANISYVLFGVALGCPTLGWLSSKGFSPKKLMLIASFSTLLSMLAIMALSNPHPFILFCCLFILGFASSSGLLVYTCLGLSIVPAIRGTALGFCNALVLLSAVILQPAVGLIITLLNKAQFSTTQSYNAGLSLLLIIFVISMIAISFAKLPKQNPFPH